MEIIVDPQSCKILYKTWSRMLSFVSVISQVDYVSLALVICNVGH